MFPVLFRVGSHVVYAYTVALVAGMLTAVWVARHTARQRRISPSAVLDVGFWVLVGGILGGRIGYVATNWAYYVDHLSSALAPRAGGLSWHGALVGGGLALACWLFGHRFSRSPVPGGRDLLDVIAPALAVGGAWGWLGCLLAGCSYGAEASGYLPPWSWLTAFLPDIYGIQAVRFATQPMMIVWCLLLTALLWSLRQRAPRGSAFAVYMFLYALADFGVAFLRGDGTWRWGLWLAQWAAVAEAGFAVVLAIYALTKPDRKVTLIG